MTAHEPGVSSFIGRQSEMALLAGALDRALAGNGQLAMLAGEPGIGKTRLANELTAIASKKEAVVLWGWCHERRGAPPYWPWLQSVRTYIDSAETEELRQDLGAGAADLAEILPEISFKIDGLDKPPDLDQEQARFRLYFAFATFIKNISRHQPLMLVLDDLHWADEPSLMLLEFLAREIATSPVMVVGTYRDVEVAGGHPLAQALGSLVREQNFHRVHLEGLSRVEVAELVEARAGVAAAESAVDSLHQRTEGNPLFVGEVVSSVSSEEIGRNEDWVANVPEAVRETILRRLSQLSESCNQILRAAAVIGRDFDISLVRSVTSDVGENDLINGIDEALGIRIIEALPSRPGQYRFGHALTHQAVYEEIPAMRMAQMHAEIGEALERSHLNNLDEHAGELAYHFAQAQTVLGTEKLVRYSLMAGQRSLAAYAHEEALALFQQGLSAKGDGDVDAESASMLFGLGRAQLSTLPRAQLHQTLDNFSKAFYYYASVGDTTNIVAIAAFPFPQLMGVDGRKSDALVARAFELVPGDSIEAGRLHSFQGNVFALRSGDYKSARESFDQALSIARREGDISLEMRTLNFAAQAELWHQNFKESQDSALVSIELATAVSDIRSEVSSRYWSCISSRALGDLAELDRQVPAIVASAERMRDRYWLASAYSTSSWGASLRGDWALAREANLRALNAMPSDPRILMQIVLVECQVGDKTQAEAHLEQLEEVFSNSGSGPTTIKACLAIASPFFSSIFGPVKRPELAHAAIDSIIGSNAATPLFTTWALVGASTLAVIDGDTEAASDYYSLLSSLECHMVQYMTTERALGLLARSLGNLQGAILHLENAQSFCRDSGYVPNLAWACYDHADLLLERNGAGDHAKATALLEEAASISSELRMKPLVERIGALQELAVAKPAREPAYPDGLTQREVEVIGLLAAGKRDREIAEELFISVNTVGNHVRSILNKTDSANRTEAAAYAFRRGLVPDEESVT